jgi:hypothetical protein
MVEALKDTAERERIRFVENEIDLSMTFLDLARTEAELDEPAAVATLVGKARVGFETAGRFLNGIASTPERERLRAKLDRLGQLLSKAS